MIILKWISVLELMRTDREFLLYGLWVATIACLAGALLFAGLSAVFAVINTATTPIGTATGVPGLYLWNSLASKFTRICWREAECSVHLITFVFDWSCGALTRADMFSVTVVTTDNHNRFNDHHISTRLPQELQRSWNKTAGNHMC